MVRATIFSLDDANPGKKAFLRRVMEEYRRVVNIRIDELWAAGTFHGRFVQGLPTVETWLSARMVASAGQQALTMVKSQRRNPPDKRVKPTLYKLVMCLDERFVSFHENQNSFDLWFRLGSIGDRKFISLPGRKHRHFNGFVEKGWTLSKSVQIHMKPDGRVILRAFFRKDAPPLRDNGRQVGIDIGIRKCLTIDGGCSYGNEMPRLLEKVRNKEKGSKAHKRALAERTAYMNRAVKDLPLEDVSLLVVERLRNVKHGKRGTDRKERNRRAPWSYPLLLGRLEMKCEERGVRVLHVSPRLTSQTCSCCGTVSKGARRGDRYRCEVCGLDLDADVNAARNILARGQEAAYGRLYGVSPIPGQLSGLSVIP